MDLISSKYRKPKGRPNNRRKTLLANLKGSSAKKIASESSDSPCTSVPIEEQATTSDVNEYIIIDKQMWSSLLENIPCSECGNYSLDIIQERTLGFSAKIQVTCNSCKKNFGSVFTSIKSNENKAFEINNMFVKAFLSIGRGYAAMETFSMVLGIPSMDKKTFAKCLNHLSKQNSLVKIEMLKISRKAVREAHVSANNSLESESIIDIGVSYDGTWQKRGHTSNLGVGCVIDILTGIVIDFEILSKCCSDCFACERDLGKKSAEFFIWYEAHKGECQKNYNGSSGGMEVAAAVAMWKRSISDCKMRYTTLLSDGDSKTLHELNRLKVYGSHVSINKEECINHIAKRLGTSLRNKVKEWQAKKVTLGGRKKGSLKTETIARLQNYYRKAIKDNAPNINKMKTSIFASLLHCMSTDAKPQHSKCPEGIDSWCFFKRAIANGKKPKSHKFMKTTLSQEVGEKILPIYQRLASTEILSRCTANKTQNANESLHSNIWRKCPKEVFVSFKRLELAVTSAVQETNFGYVGTLMNNFNVCEINDISVSIANKKDNRRNAQKKRKSTEAYKKAKNVKKYKKSQAIKQQEESEGVMYEAGAF